MVIEVLPGNGYRADPGSYELAIGSGMAVGGIQDSCTKDSEDAKSFSSGNVQSPCHRDREYEQSEISDNIAKPLDVDDIISFDRTVRRWLQHQIQVPACAYWSTCEDAEEHGGSCPHNQNGAEDP